MRYTPPVPKNDPMIPLLPKLRASITGFQNLTAGWNPRPIGDLLQVADAMDISTDETLRPIAVDAIPDMWARSLLYSLALEDSTHPLHSGAVSSLRGLVSLLGLRRRRHLQVRSSAVLLSSSKSTLLQALGKLAPFADSCPPGTWDPVHVILISDEPIAITSPLTLLCPNEGPHLTGLAVRILNAGAFADPTPRLRTKERAMLAAYVQRMVRSIASQTALIKAGHILPLLRF